MKIKLFHFLNISKIGGAFIGLLIFLSILTFTLETEYTESKFLKSAGFYIAIIFMLEYFARIWTAGVTSKDRMNSRLTYIFSFYGLIDLLAFLPALLIPAANGSILIRVARVLRLIQIIKYKPLTRGIKRVGTALRDCKTELLVSMAISLLLIFIGAVSMYLVEGKTQPESFGSVPRALWWSVATLTTVGYGDVYPITSMGKLIAAAMSLIGIAAVAMPAGILAAAFSRVTQSDDEYRRR